MDPIARETAEQNEIDLEKKTVTQTVRPVSSSDDEAASEANAEAAWAPGFWKRFPWLGFGALFTILLCSMGSILTLMLSNGRSETRWVEKLPPNVILNGLNNVQNLCFGMAIGNGIAIAWWRKTLKGATIQELHRSWTFSTSLKDIAFAAKYFNIIALAALTAKLTIIDGTLMQKAFSTYSDVDMPITTNVSMFANHTFPATGVIASRSSSSGTLLPWFMNDLKLWSQSGGMLSSSFQGCEGRCLFNIPAAGFAFDCDEPVTEQTDIGATTQSATSQLSQIRDGMLNVTDTEMAALEANYTQALFGISFAANSTLAPGSETAAAHYLTMDLIYTTANDVEEDQGCPGQRVTQHCELRPAVISYPVMVQNYSGLHALNGLTVGVTQDSLNAEKNETGPIYPIYDQRISQQHGYDIVERVNVTTEGSYEFPGEHTRLGGVLQGLQEFVSGSAGIYWTGAAGFMVNQTGVAQQYLLNETPLGTSQCGYQYTDSLFPTSQSMMRSVVQQINELIFTLATDLSEFDPSNDRDAVTVAKATVYRDSIHYRTNIYYMIGAVISTFICVLCVLPSYWGFWQLGRKVALSPFEIAAAFRSPMVNHPGTIDDILKHRGHQPVQYGNIVSGDASGRLGVAEPEYVERAHPKLFGGRKGNA
ncbi:hypothetical protein B0A48_10531 [Cryoendolithus antarcticus]|uniref:Uncharacterized protein n=1 Tax=Cryoendolithus antarcticus TaxID=1507870 RepID=A0A1V8SXU7_9PEZI|nr:hypothetical protein B0A48_10531 [Cryoendolithus antarcticus]